MGEQWDVWAGMPLWSIQCQEPWVWNRPTVQWKNRWTESVASIQQCHLSNSRLVYILQYLHCSGHSVSMAWLGFGWGESHWGREKEKVYRGHFRWLYTRIWGSAARKSILTPAGLKTCVVIGINGGDTVGNRTYMTRNTGAPQEILKILGKGRTRSMKEIIFQ